MQHKEGCCSSAFALPEHLNCIFQNPGNGGSSAGAGVMGGLLDPPPHCNLSQGRGDARGQACLRNGDVVTSAAFAGKQESALADREGLNC